MSRLQWPLAIALILFAIWKYLEVSRLYHSCINHDGNPERNSKLEKIDLEISNSMKEVKISIILKIKIAVDC